MLRSILAAIGGYAVMIVIVLAGIGVAWMALGAAGAFSGEGPAPSTPWIILNVLSGFIAAFIGGLVARRIGGSQTAVRILIGLVLVVGFALAALGGLAEPPVSDKPVTEMSFSEANQHAQPPAWYNWLLPVIGAAGVLFGGRERN